MGSTPIEWTADDTGRPGYTWNAGIFGCNHDGPECLHCYAERMAHRQVAMGNYPDGITRLGRHGPEFTGLVVVDRQGAIDGAEALPKLRKPWPRFVFTSSMSDVGHPRVPIEHLRLVWNLIRARPWLVFLLLTKRPGHLVELHEQGELGAWPANAWLGTTAGDQAAWARRVPDLQRAGDPPVLFVSAEPLLGPADPDAAGWWSTTTSTPCDRCEGRGTVYRHVDGQPGQDWCDSCDGNGETTSPNVRWIIGGGELGPRPCHPAWARQLRDQALGAGAAFTWKQWGSWVPEEELRHHPELVASLHVVEHRYVESGLEGVPAARMLRVVGRCPIRTLDGVVWDQRPAVPGWG